MPISSSASAEQAVLRLARRGMRLLGGSSVNGPPCMCDWRPSPPMPLLKHSFYQLLLTVIDAVASHLWQAACRI